MGGISLASCRVRMANSTQENKALNKGVLASRSTDMAQCPSSQPSNQFVVDINNCAVVIVGDNNVINVDSSTLSNNTELQRKSLSDLWSERVSKGDAKIDGLDFTEQNMAKISQKNRRVPRCPVEMLVQEEKSAAISTISPVVKCKQHNCGCVDEERKRECGIGAAVENLQKKRCNRKRRKRQGCNPNHTTSSSDEDRREATLNELSFENDRSTFQEALQTLHFCVNALRPLLLNCRWAEFERVAEELLLFKDDAVTPTREITVVLEKSIAFAHRMNDLERTEDMMNNAVKKIEQTSGSVRLLLEVFSKGYLASLYRRRKMFGKAETCLEVAWKLASGFPPCWPVMILLYQFGSFKMEIASMFPGSRTEYSGATEGKKLLDGCIKMCVQLDGKSSFAMYVEHYASVKIALMNLNCETSLSRDKDIIRQNIVEAEERLGTLETEFCSNKEMEVLRIRRLIAKVDLCYRLEEYYDAEEIAQETLEMSEKFGVKLELTRVQQRLIDIRRKITESLSNETFRDIPKMIDSCSPTNNSPNSSVYYTCSSN